jgi:hypothetical protein
VVRRPAAGPGRAGPTSPALAWNPAAVVRLLDTTVRISAPDERTLRGALALLPAEAAVEPGGPWAGWVAVHREDTGWRVTGSHIAPRRLSSGTQVAAHVRRAALHAAAATTSAVPLTATALVDDDPGAVVVLASPEERVQIAKRWLDRGGRVAADAVVALDGGRALPARLGVIHEASYQWIDGDPPPWDTPGAPAIGPTGQLLARWAPPTSAVSDESVAPRLFVLPGGAEGLLTTVPPDVGLWALLAARLPGRTRLEAPEAAMLVEMVRTTAVASTATHDAAATVALVRTLSNDAFCPDPQRSPVEHRSKRREASRLDGGAAEP